MSQGKSMQGVRKEFLFLPLVRPGIRQTVLAIEHHLYAVSVPETERVVILLSQIVDVLGFVGEKELRQVFSDLKKIMTTVRATVIRDAQEALCDFLYAIQEYLDRLCVHNSAYLLNLYSYYEKAMHALQAPRVHPADLYFCPRDKHVPLAKIQAVPKRHEDLDYDAMSLSLELLIKGNATSSRLIQEIYKPALQIISQVAGAEDMAEDRAAWTILMTAVEVMIEIAQPRMHHVDMFLHHVGMELKKRVKGPGRVDYKVINDSLFLIAHSTSGEGRAEEIIKQLGLVRIHHKDYAAIHFYAANPRGLLELQEGFRQLRKVWYGFLEGAPKQQQLFLKLAAQMQVTAEMLHYPVMDEIFVLFRRIAEDVSSYRNNHAFLYEISRFILFIGASVYAFYHLPAKFAQIVHDLTFRVNHINQVQDATFMEEVRTFIAEVAVLKYRERVQDEILSSLMQVEALLEDCFFVSRRKEQQEQAMLIIDDLINVMQVLSLQDGEVALKSARDLLQRDLFSQENPEAWKITQNIAAVSMYLQSLRHTEMQSSGGFFFDEQHGVVMIGHDSCDVFLEKSKARFAAMHMSETVGHAADADVIYREDDDVADAFFQEMADILNNLDDTTALLRAADGVDDGQVETLQYCFYQMQESSHLARQRNVTQLAEKIVDKLQRQVAVNMIDVRQLSTFMEQLIPVLRQWLAMPDTVRRKMDFSGIVQLLDGMDEKDA